MLKNITLTVLFAASASLFGAQSLHADWTGGGISLCSAGGAQDTPAITADGSGGAVIVWRDARAVVNTDIYAQGVTADGAVRWYSTGMPVCVVAYYQSAPLVIPDGAGGTIIAWQDPRTGDQPYIYAQKLSSIGYIQWPTNGVAICTGQTGLILGGMVSDGAGGAIITWHDRRNFYNDIFAQRIASNGAVQWTANGVPVCTDAAVQQNPSLAPDGSGGAIIAWEDRRSGNYDIYAQRLNASGVPQWTADGIVICDSDQNQVFPRVAEDGSGGAVIAWADRRNTMNYDIFAQRVDASGALQWGFGTPVSAEYQNQEACRLVHIGSGITIVAWLDGRSGTSVDIYAQKLSAAGAAQWTSNGIAVCAATGDQNNVRIVDNGAGGAFISWDDARSGASNIDVYAQNVDSGGSPVWTADGKSICGATGNQREAAIFADGSNGMFVAWTDGRAGTDKAYSHRVDATGNIPTATLLFSYSAEPAGNTVRIEWTLSEIDEGAEFRILRATGAPTEYREIADAEVIADGLSFTFIDTDCEAGLSYFYRVVFTDGEKSAILFEAGPVGTPAIDIALLQNSPNPFNPRTTIGYSIPEACRVRLEIFDAAGRRVRLLVDEIRQKGGHSVDWDGTASAGTPAASGVYFYRLTAGKSTLTRKMVLLR
jgi:hypothetical protein